MKITGHTKLLGLFADPASHSQSPLIYNTAFEKLGIDYAYMAFTVPEGRIEDAVLAMKTLGMRGANISMPHKQAIIPYLDYVSERARMCQAVNTVINDGGILKGYNTDIIGATYAIKNLDVKISESRAILLGLGGAGKAILTGLATEKAKRIRVFVRGVEALNSGDLDGIYRAKEAKNFIEGIKSNTNVQIDLFDVENKEALNMAMRESDILINSTNIGMGKNRDKSLIPDTSYFHKDLTVMDAIYYPEKTKLLIQAEEAGCRKLINGLEMLLFQAEEAFSLFTGQKMPMETVRDKLLEMGL